MLTDGSDARHLSQTVVPMTVVLMLVAGARQRTLGLLGVKLPGVPTLVVLRVGEYRQPQLHYVKYSSKWYQMWWNAKKFMVERILDSFSSTIATSLNHR
jgi:hypothetical protein